MAGNSNETISSFRQLMYYSGMLITVVGALLFISVFFLMSQTPTGVQPGVVYRQTTGTPPSPETIQTMANMGISWDSGPDIPLPRSPQELQTTATTRALTGMGLIVLGSFMMTIGKRGLAGAGVILDPQLARKDLEPWARMGGGMVKDALDSAGIDLRENRASPPLPLDERLRRLKKLRDEGLISEQEFEESKEKILDSA